MAVEYVAIDSAMQQHTGGGPTIAEEFERGWDLVSSAWAGDGAMYGHGTCGRFSGVGRAAAAPEQRVAEDDHSG